MREAVQHRAFNSFWPLFQLALKDEKLKAAIINAKTQLDFSVMMLTLACITALGWTMALGLWCGDDVRLFLCFVGLGALACWYSLHTVHWTYAAFASVVRASIDMARFDVLDRLRISTPGTLLAERLLWDQVKRLIVAHDLSEDIAFKPAVKP